MLLHDYLRKKSAILTKAKAEVDNLLTEITDPKTKELVDDWEPGDPITDLYPQTDQKGDETAAKSPEVEKTPFVSESKPEDHPNLLGSLVPIDTAIPPVASPILTAVPGTDVDGNADDTNHTV